MKKTITIIGAALAALLIAGSFGTAGASGHGQPPTIHKVASLDDGTAGGQDSVNTMTMQEWYDFVMTGQHEGNVEWACDCHGFTLAKWRGSDRHMRKEVEYPQMNADGTSTNPYGDIVRYRQGRYGHWTTDKVKYLAVDGDAFPFYFDDDGNASTRLF